MPPKLFTAWYRVVIFWWLILFIWYTSDNSVIEQAFKAVTGKPMYITGLNALPALWAILAGWTVPVLIATGIAIVGGYALTLAGMLVRERFYRLRVKPHPVWSGVSVTMGVLPKPFWSPDNISGVEVDGLPIKGVYASLLNQIFSYLNHHPKAFVGAGHEGSLADHTLHVIQHMPESKDPLLAVAIAGHDAGKVLAWERQNGKWVMKGYHDDLSAMVVSQMPAYAELSVDEQRVLFVVLKYGHKWSQRPVEPDSDISARCERIYAELSRADHTATALEKKSVLSKVDTDELIFSGFVNAIQTLPFQSFGLKRGAITAGWRVGRRLYLIEPTIRDEIIGNMDENVKSAYSSDFRMRGQITAFTKDFLALMDKKGWLVKEIDGFAGHDPAMWSIESSAGGEGAEVRKFDGIIILDLPEDYKGGLPKPTQYQITVARAFGSEKKDKKTPALEIEVGVKTGVPHEEKNEGQKRDAPILAAIAGYGFGAVAKAKKEIKTTKAQQIFQGETPSSTALVRDVEVTNTLPEIPPTPKPSKVRKTRTADRIDLS